ncbi:hypothetical protein [Arthrobacter sp. H20]|uniref:hypothetical protein n=1 Tax=Arthrobacter sp. H20 TaxID=1267981 RepID=UPI0009DE3181|nr:hypothetical protein [Arthrobacter sp. H20]
MCRATTCMHCQKTTWSGCGNHVEQVMRAVPSRERCTCASSGGRASVVPKTRASSNWLAQLFGR